MSQKIKKKNKIKKDSSQDLGKIENTPEIDSKPSAMATNEAETMSKSEKENILRRLEEKLETVNKKIDDCLRLQEFNFKQLSDKVKVQEDKIEKADAKIENLSKKLTNSEIKRESQSDKFKELEDKIEQLERDKRKKTIVIEGVKESKENTPENVIIDLFRDVGMERGICDVDAFFRRGRLNDANPRPRAIVITFVRLSDKILLFRSLHKLKNNDEWRHIYVNDDLTEKQLSEIRDLKALNALARSQGTNSYMRGNQLVINDQKYNASNLDKLPGNITMEKAKNRKVDGDKGLAFQGHHSVLSNMAKCDLVYNGHLFTSSEAAIQFEKAKICEAKREAAVIQTSEAYKAKSIGKTIKENKEWDTKKVEIIYEITKEKFKQNDEMRAKLLATENLRLYEATPSKYWGCGLSMTRLNEIGEGRNPGQNKFGQILEKVRNELKK